MKLGELKNISDSFTQSGTMPALFIGHGNPMNALYDNPFTKSLKEEVTYGAMSMRCFQVG